jgi:hypothetical protein
MQIKIGQIIYVRMGSWSRYFNPFRVVNETSRSWVVVRPETPEWVYTSERAMAVHAIKLPKNGRDWELGTANDSLLASWVGNNIRTICGYLEAERDNRKILEVAKLLGVKNLFEEKADAQGVGRSH